MTADTLSLQLTEAQISDADDHVLQATFAPLFDQAQGWRRKAEAITVDSADDRQGMAEAREARLALKDIRVAAEHARKRLKEESLRKGKAIDGMANVIKFLIVPIEEDLERKEKFAELQRERAVALLAEKRRMDLTALGVDHTLYALEDMGKDAYAKLLEEHKAAAAARKEAEEQAERVAREQAEAAERERLRVENERLRKEADEREREAAREREAKEKAEAELWSKRQEEERIERERQEAERRRIERERQAQLAPDKEKLMQLAAGIAAVPVPVVSSDQATAVVNKAIKLLAEASEFVKNQSATL